MNEHLLYEPNIGILDYGAGNIASIENAFTRLGHNALKIVKPNLLENVSHLILPGVGSFAHAMHSLHSQGWIPHIKKYISQGYPFLGICLGMQLLFDIGTEGEQTDGLGLLKGQVLQIKPSIETKVPHVGWNSIQIKSTHPVFKGIKDSVDFYFVHSYHCVPDDTCDIIATCDYSEDGIVASVYENNIVGIQFHPEKSQPLGLRILNNFANWDGKC